jgi:DNA-binding protein Alba
MNDTNTTKNIKKRSDRKMAEKQQDVIFVGNKPPMSYVLAIITAFSQGNLKEITLKARGQAITTAVDVAEITRSRFMKDLKVTTIAIGTAEMPPREGENRSRMVSTIEVTLTKA